MASGLPALDRALEALSRLPGVGRRSAERMAFHLLKADRAEVLALADAIRDLKEKIRPCVECGSLAEEDVCPLCADPKRDDGLLCVVETPRDVAAIEDSGEYRGRYHVLMGRLSPLSGVGVEDLRIAKLLDRVKAGGFREIIIATSPTVEGEATAQHIAGLLKGCGIQITRIAKGVPSGSDLEFAQKSTLAEAIRGRKPLS
ncbi:MAG: recombination mediator RecR [Planctomycetota bacterium]|nr:recombination mediator RecR [Planctomycetota bacterium]